MKISTVKYEFNAKRSYTFNLTFGGFQKSLLIPRLIPSMAVRLFVIG